MLRTWKRRRPRDWARTALEIGFLLTEPRLRAGIANRTKEWLDDLKDGVSKKYDDAVERAASAGLIPARDGRRRRLWHLVSFFAGIGVGTGMGLLVAPASGKETRGTLLNKAADVKERIAAGSAATAGRVRRATSDLPTTGTL